MNTSWTTGVLLLALWISVSGCGLMPEPPVVCTGARVVEGDRGLLHRSRGLYLDIANTGTSTVSRVRIAADLFGQAEDPSVPGPRSLDSWVDVDLLPGGTATICANLDHIALWLAPGRVRVGHALLLNGHRWTNPGLLMCEQEPI